MTKTTVETTRDELNVVQYQLSLAEHQLKHLTLQRELLEAKLFYFEKKGLKASS